jgi:hypothetical protein
MSSAAACAALAGVHSLDCGSITSIIIQAILNLANPAGSTDVEIFNYIPVICPAAPYSQTDVTNAINNAARKGILFRAIATVGATPTYLVNAYMKNFNYQNRVYSRYPQQCGSFFNCG